MTATDYINDVTANLTDWGIAYRETTEGISVGNIHLEIAEDGYSPAATILDGTELVGVTSDADKAAALLAFPLARKAWYVGYTGDFDVDIYGPEMSMRFRGWGWGATVSAAPGESDSFTIMEHPLSLIHI